MPPGGLRRKEAALSRTFLATAILRFVLINGDRVPAGAAGGFRAAASFGPPAEGE